MGPCTGKELTRIVGQIAQSVVQGIENVVMSLLWSASSTRRRFRPFARDKLMAGFAVIGAIRINMSQLTPQRVEQSGQYLGIMDIFQRDFRRHDIVGHWVYRQMQLAPDSPLLGTVFSGLPLAFTKHLQPGGVDNQIGNASLPFEGCR